MQIDKVSALDMIQTAVVGCGYWGPNLIRNCMQSKSVNLCWVCDRDAARLENVMTPFPGVRKTTSFEEVLDDQVVKAVIIATPVSSHFSLAQSAIMRGKHVLLEKPLAASVAEGEELVRLAREHNVRLMCDHTFCYTGAVRKIKSIIDAGELGELLYYDSVRINLGLFQNDVNVLWDLAVHDLAIVDFLFDRQPTRVSAHGVTHTPNGHENLAYVTLSYSDSFIAHFHVNWLSPVKIRKTLIGGSNKMIEWNDLVPAEKVKVYDCGVRCTTIAEEEKSRLLVSYRTGDIHSPRVDSSEALALVIDEFADSIGAGRPPLTDGEAALRVLRVLEAAEKSIKAGGIDIRLDS